MPPELFPVPLVCPLCREPDAGVAARLEGAEGADRCPRCGAEFPRLGGVCDLLPRPVPPPVHLGEETSAAPDFGALGEAEELCRRAGADPPEDGAFEAAFLLGSHALAHFPPEEGPLGEELRGNLATLATARSWLARHAAPRAAAACLLEAGCGPGAFLLRAAPLFRDGALGLDASADALLLARRLAEVGEAWVPFREEGRRFAPRRVEAPRGEPVGAVHLLRADVAAPPLEAESFPAVAAFSLLDTVPDPLFVLGQLDALLAPGGLLLLATPWSWEERATPRAAWWGRPGAASADLLRAALAGRHPALPHLAYELLEEEELPWALPGHARLVHRFRLDALLARKAG